MNITKFIELLFAGGFGAFFVKLLDFNNERNKWKRDKKFSVFAKVARDLISQQEWGTQKRSSELHALIGEATLLIENNDLLARSVLQ